MSILSGDFYFYINRYKILFAFTVKIFAFIEYSCLKNYIFIFVLVMNSSNRITTIVLFIVVFAVFCFTTPSMADAERNIGK